MSKMLNDRLQSLQGDKAIWMIAIILGLFSILAIYSSIGSEAYKSRGGNTEYYLVQQLIFLAAGFMVMFFASRIHYMHYNKFAPIVLVITIPLLAYTLGFGEQINDARRWINIPMIDRTIQTSDLAKIAIIMYVARSLSRKQESIKDFKTAFLPIIIPITIVCALIAPADLSTALLLFCTCILMMVIGRVSMKYIFLMVLVGIAMLGLIVLIGTAFPELVRLDTWISRMDAFMNNTDGGYQIQQAKIAIANGDIFGVLPGNSVQRNFLPYAYADFIFAVICEEYGIIGATVIIGLFLWLLFRCTNIVTRCPAAFGAILAMGLCLNIVIQAFANIAVSVHLVPVTGLTLPMISMGGTSLIFTCFSFGVILSVSRYVDENYKKIQLANAKVN